MASKLQWLESQRQQILISMEQSHNQSATFTSSLLSQLKNQEIELSSLRSQFKSKQTELQNQIMKVCCQVKSLEAVILAKEEQCERLKDENQKFRQQNTIKRDENQQLRSRLLQIQHAMKVNSEQAAKKLIELRVQIDGLTAVRKEEIDKITKNHQDELLSRENTLVKQHEEEIAELKKFNLTLIQKLQSDNQAISVKSNQLSKQNQSQYARLTQENIRLLSINNDLKHKTLDLQATLSNQVQQGKIREKQSQIKRQNMRRQLEILREERLSLLEKNKELKQKSDQLSWNIKEIGLKRDEQLKKVRYQVDRSFQEVLSRAQQEIRETTQQAQVLKEALKERQSRIKQLEAANISFKQVLEERQAQAAQLKDQRQALLNHITTQSSPFKQIQELKAEVIRKNCEIDVLKAEVKRLKTKVNSIATAYEQYVKLKEAMENENKMLLSQIVFLRQKEKRGKKDKNNISNSNILNELNSERSQICEDIEEYKKMIEFMTQEMNDVCRKVIQKDNRIEKLEAQLKRYEFQLSQR